MNLAATLANVARQRVSGWNSQVKFCSASGTEIHGREPMVVWVNPNQYGQDLAFGFAYQAQ